MRQTLLKLAAVGLACLSCTPQPSAPKSARITTTASTIEELSNDERLPPDLRSNLKKIVPDGTQKPLNARYARARVAETIPAEDERVEPRAVGQGACCHAWASEYPRTLAECQAIGGTWIGDKSSKWCFNCAGVSLDINGDGRINGADIQAFTHALVEFQTGVAWPDSEILAICASDLNRDERIDAADAAMLVHYLIDYSW